MIRLHTLLFYEIRLIAFADSASIFPIVSLLCNYVINWHQYLVKWNIVKLLCRYRKILMVLCWVIFNAAWFGIVFTSYVISTLMPGFIVSASLWSVFCVLFLSSFQIRRATKIQISFYLQKYALNIISIILSKMTSYNYVTGTRMRHDMALWLHLSIVSAPPRIKLELDKLTVCNLGVKKVMWNFNKRINKVVFSFLTFVWSLTFLLYLSICSKCLSWILPLSFLNTSNYSIYIFTD